MNNEANDLDNQYKILSCRSTIFEHNKQFPFTENCENPLSEELWNDYVKEFQWLLVNNNVIKCKICKDAFNKCPDKFDNNEWVTENSTNFPLYNRHTLLLVLKFHQLSDNHINSLNILKLDSNTSTNGHTSYKLIAPAPITMDNSRTNHLVPIAPLTSVIQHMDSSFEASSSQLTNNLKPLPIANSIWSRYLSVYRWLYIKTDNMPGCRLCEEASEISGRMARTRWTDPTGQIPPTVGSMHVNTDRPQRTLNQHNHSSNHRLAEEILGRNNLLLEISRTHLPPNYRLNYPAVFSDEDWSNYCGKYPWLYYNKSDDGYHCIYCEQAFSVYPTRLKSTSWTSRYGNSREKIDNRLRARKSLSEHQRSLNHNIAEELLRYSGKSALRSPTIHQDDQFFNMQQNIQNQNKDSSSISNINENSTQNINDSDSDDVSGIQKQNGTSTTNNTATNNNSNISSNINTNNNQTLSLFGHNNNNNPQYYDEYSEDPVVPIDTTLWFRLRQKYYWLQGDNGKSYGCSVCQTAYNAHSSIVSPTNWTRGLIPFTSKSKYMHLRKKFYQHSGCRKHLECEKLLVQNTNSNNSNNGNATSTNNNNNSNVVSTSQNVLIEGSINSNNSFQKSEPVGDYCALKFNPSVINDKSFDNTHMDIPNNLAANSIPNNNNNSTNDNFHIYNDTNNNSNTNNSSNSNNNGFQPFADHFIENITNFHNMINDDEVDEVIESIDTSNANESNPGHTANNSMDLNQNSFLSSSNY